MSTYEEEWLYTSVFMVKYHSVSLWEYIGSILFFGVGDQKKDIKLCYQWATSLTFTFSFTNKEIWIKDFQVLSSYLIRVIIIKKMIRTGNEDAEEKRSFLYCWDCKKWIHYGNRIETLISTILPCDLAITYWLYMFDSFPWLLQVPDTISL